MCRMHEGPSAVPFAKPEGNRMVLGVHTDTDQFWEYILGNLQTILAIVNADLRIAGPRGQEFLHVFPIRYVSLMCGAPVDSEYLQEGATVKTHDRELEFNDPIGRVRDYGRLDQPRAMPITSSMQGHLRSKWAQDL